VAIQAFCIGKLEVSRFEYHAQCASPESRLDMALRGVVVSIHSRMLKRKVGEVN
jgi:hypothetical protein